MLIFNCSRAFAGFIEPRARTGQPGLVEAPPSPDTADDEALLRNGELSGPLQQWCVHLVRRHRQPCVVAMELETRYAVLLTGLKSHDPEDFFTALVERLINTQHFAARDLGLETDFSSMLASFLAHHREFRFFLRPHRSAQSHIKEVVWMLDNFINDIGALPLGHPACAAFDARVNDFLRKTGQRRDYFVPATEMLTAWLRAHGDLSEEGEARLREAIAQRDRRRFAE